MRVLATYIMRGRWQAMLATTGLGVMTLVLPPLTWPLIFLSGAAVVLVTLVQGQREGLLNAAGATLLVALLGSLLALPWQAAAYAALLCLPTWGLALVLLRTRTLVPVLLFNTVVCGLVLSTFYLLVDDPAGYWYTFIKQQLLHLFKEAGMQVPAGKESEMQLVLQQLSRQMTGSLAAWVSFGWLVCTLIGRWWQSTLYRPGAFGEEFRRLFLGMPAALAVLVLAVPTQFGDGLMAQWSQNLLFVLLVPFLFQGVAVGHSIVNKTRANPAWLIVMYLMLAFAPGGLLFGALLGLLDNGINFRARIRPAQG